jgi:hypothetical protein
MMRRGGMGMRRGRAVRRTTRRRTRQRVRRAHQVQRVHRRRRRRRILVGGAVLLAGGYAAYKLTQRDTERVEEYTGKPAEDLTEEELVAAMEQLGIKSIELDEDDQAYINQAEAEDASTGASAGPEAVEPSYLDELERLGQLRDEGVITDEEFEAKKKELLGL